MKKLIIAAAIVLTSGVTALSVTKSQTTHKQNPETSVQKSDFAGRTYADSKSDLATIE